MYVRPQLGPAGSPWLPTGIGVDGREEPPSSAIGVAVWLHGAIRTTLDR